MKNNPKNYIKLYKIYKLSCTDSHQIREEKWNRVMNGFSLAGYA